VEAQKASTTALADTFAKLAGTLIEQNRHAEAEAPARQCLELRTAQGAGVWQTNDARVLLGAALMGRGQVADAEREFLAVVSDIEPLLPQADDAGRARYAMALKKLTNLYNATGRRREATEWRKKLDALPH
jgi:tetratricopeptide (TPR) repeat protein